MKVGLIDADYFWARRRPQKVFPNLCLMKLSAWHKAQGDEVSFFMGVEGYDRVYISKVFTATPQDPMIINAREVYYGGSGYCIQRDPTTGREYWQEPDGPNFMSALPFEVEHIMPDYSLYGISDTAYGFLSRGCPRGCHFCHVAAKEGRRSYKVADLSEWWDGQRNIVLCDPNILACRESIDLLSQLADSRAYVDINQGLDARLITPEKVEVINRIKLKGIHFAWDDYKQKKQVLRGLEFYAAHATRKPHGTFAVVYVLTNFDTTPEQDLERVNTLRTLGYEPYVMVYDKPHAARFYTDLQNWVNNKYIFGRVERFEDYDPHARNTANKQKNHDQKLERPRRPLLQS